MLLTDAIKAQVSQAHTTATQVLEGLTDEQLHQRLTAATIDPIASVFAHLVIAEDGFVHRYLLEKPRLFDNGWGDRLGLTEAERDHHFENFHMRDRAAFMEYAGGVFAATDAYLTSVGDEDLGRMVKMRDREQPAWFVLSRLVAGHGLQHSGEMAALKGVLGLKGSAF